LWDPGPYAGINSYAPVIGVETKRGCALNCAYCVYPQLQGRRFRCRPVAGVVDEIELLGKEFDIRTFHFNDSVLNVPTGHLEAICREILRRRLEVRWDGFFREDHLDANNIALFEEAGCECFSFSPDGLCQEALDVLDKGLTEDDIFRAAGLAAQRGVLSVYHFLVNVPGETAATCDKAIRTLERIYDLHAAGRNLGTVVLNNIRILPGTKIERIARREGVIGPATDLLYPTYYNPRPFESFRYRLETLHLCKNVFMWKGVTEP
jgi:putative variant cofactor biosynthesis B12-binding/radical SAM domain protein 1